MFQAYLLMDGQAYRLIHQITTIGRHLDNDLVLQSPFISRYHAEIRYEEGVYTIEDKNSTGSVFVNDKKITSAELSSGDIIKLAYNTLIFVIDTDNLADNGERITEPIPDK